MSKNEKILTIITVVKNDKENILNTIQSVLKQNTKNFEYIIFDGNSTDGTSEIIKSLKSKKIKYFRKKDLNLYDAINRSVTFAKGKYIGLLHSGDIFIDKNHLKKIINILRKEPDIISGNLAFYNKYQKKILTSRVWRHLINKFRKNSVFKIPHPSVYIKKKLIKKVNYYNIKYSISSDFDFLLKLSKIKKLKYLYIDNFFLLMKNQGLSTRRNYLFLKIKEDLIILSKNYSLFFLVMYFYKIFIKIPGFFKFRKKIFIIK